VICGSCGAASGFADISPRSQAVLDLFLSHDLYFLTMVGWANADKDDYPANSAEKQILFGVLYTGYQSECRP
jgi:hypothetical protein